MPIASDFTIDYGAKTVTHSSGATVYTALEFFQWLAAEFASSSQMDDDYAFVSDTPTVYRWVNGWAFGDHEADPKFLKGGSIESSDGLALWSNMYSIGSQEAGTQIYVVQNDAEVSAWWGPGNIDILLQVKSAGAWITSLDTEASAHNGGAWAFAREHGDSYDHNFIDLSGGGRNPVGINTAADAGNLSTEASASTAAAAISVVFSAAVRDLNNGNGSNGYNCEVDCAGYSMAKVYEALKWRTKHNSPYNVNGDAGEEYRAAIEGTYTDVKVAPFGTLAGTTMYGARGIWFTNYLAADFVLIDASGTTQNPPNYQKVNCTHDSLVSCQVFVAVLSAGTVKKNQYTASATSSAGVVAIAGGGTIHTDKTPLSGQLRFGDTTYTYASFTGDKFYGVSPSAIGGASGDFYVPLLDVTADASTELSDNIVQSSTLAVRTVVRKYGFKPYTQDTEFGSTGLSFTPILSDDPQAT